MCNKAAYAAIAKIESDLGDNEHIVWSGVPDRSILAKKAKQFYWKNVSFLAAIGVAAASVYAFQPNYARFMLTILGALAVIRLIGSYFAWHDRAKRKRQAYSLTNKRLVSVDGKTLDLTSWYAPLIDQLSIKKIGHTASFRMRDTDLGFEMNFHYAPEPEKLSKLLAQYRMQTQKDKAEEQRKQAKSPIMPLSLSDTERDWHKAA